MGYNTEFQGYINITPPLNDDDHDWLTELHDTRHGGNFDTYAGFPGLYCQWEPNIKGDEISWDGNEKFYDSAEWMKYIIDHLCSRYTFNGEIKAQGEDMDDRWKLIVDNNAVTVEDLE